jgi:hypothetical protein
MTIRPGMKVLYNPIYTIKMNISYEYKLVYITVHVITAYLTIGLLVPIIVPIGMRPERLQKMIIKTRVYEFASVKYENLSHLARAMGLSVSQVYRVREGKRGINEKFIIGAKLAFPDHRLDELFYFQVGSPLENRKETAAAGSFLLDRP